LAGINTTPVKLIKINGVWNVRFKSEHGTKTLSTKCTDKTAAMKVVSEAGIEKLELAAMAGKLSREAVGRIVTGKRITMEQALDIYKEWMNTVGRSPKTIHNNVSTIKTWLAERKLGAFQPSAITEEHIDKWINDPESETKSGTRSVNLAAIRSMFHMMCAKGWTFADPSALVEVRMNIMSHEQKEKAVRAPFTDAEYRLLMAELLTNGGTDSLFWRFAIASSYHMALRLGDICQLEWSCFKVPGYMSVWTDKRDRRVSLKIHDDVMALMTELPIESRSHLFPKQLKIITDPVKRAALSVQFKRLCDRCGIKGKSFHCLRHSCITEWSRLGKTLEQIAGDAGHSDTKTTEGYIH
jgi:integrase